jgi:hypothetical protein
VIDIFAKDDDFSVAIGGLEVFSDFLGDQIGALFED